MQKLRTATILFISWVVYFFSYLVPRNKRIWVFVGWHKTKNRETFADNSKYLFLHVANVREDIRAIWIARDKRMSRILQKQGYESYDVHSLRGVYYSLRAGYTIIDALMQLHNWRLSGRSKTIQLWHADGIKKLRRSSAWSLKKLPQILFSPSLYKRFHFFIASSPYIAENFVCPSFDVPKDKVHITGLPRYDVFFGPIPGAQIDIHLELQEKLDGLRTTHPKKIILYAPTFRREKTSDSQLDHIRFDELNEFLAEKEYVLFVSLHPKFAASQWLRNDFSNIYFINPDFDKYPLLPRFDMVITDYSSICLEFLLLDKPAIFYVYDFEEYKKNPGIPEEFWNLVPGPRVKTFDELCQALEAPDTLATERERVRNILFTFNKGGASAAVAQKILREIN